MQAWFWQVDLGISLVLHNNAKNWWNSASWSLKISHCFSIFLCFFFCFMFFVCFCVFFYYLLFAKLKSHMKNSGWQKKIWLFWTQQAQKKKKTHELKNIYIMWMAGFKEEQASYEELSWWWVGSFKFKKKKKTASPHKKK